MIDQNGHANGENGHANGEEINGTEIHINGNSSSGGSGFINGGVVPVQQFVNNELSKFDMFETIELKDAVELSNVNFF